MHVRDTAQGAGPDRATGVAAATADISATEARELLVRGLVEERDEKACHCRPGRKAPVQAGRQGPILLLTAQGLAQAAAALAALGVGGVSGELRPRVPPRWLDDSSELRVGGVVVKRLRHDAEGQRCVLQAFERHGWPRWLEDPLEVLPGIGRKKRLRDTVARLNRGQPGPLRVRFGAERGASPGKSSHNHT
jgi:hypothetical protein